MKKLGGISMLVLAIGMVGAVSAPTVVEAVPGHDLSWLHTGAEALPGDAAAFSCVGKCTIEDCDEGGHRYYHTIWNQHEGNQPHGCGNLAVCDSSNGHESCLFTFADPKPEDMELLKAPNSLTGQDLWALLDQNDGSGFSVDMEAGALQRLSCSGNGELALHIPLSESVLSGFVSAQQQQ